MGSRRPVILTILVLVFGVLEREADAYIDPGTGSMAIQLIVATLAGVLVALGKYWRKASALLRHLLKR